MDFFDHIVMLITLCVLVNSLHYRHQEISDQSQKQYQHLLEVCTQPLPQDIPQPIKEVLLDD